jgi:hypothetical protein
MRYATYNLITGEVIRVGYCQSSDLALQANAGEASEECQDEAIVANGLWTRLPDGTYFELIPPPPTVAELNSYARQKSNQFIGSMISYISNATTIDSDCDQGTVSDWMALQQWAAASPTATKNWVTNDFRIQPLPASEVPSIAEMVGTRRAAIFAEFANVLDGIAVGTITTKEQIDSAPWPI